MEELDQVLAVAGTQRLGAPFPGGPLSRLDLGEGTRRRSTRKRAARERKGTGSWQEIKSREVSSRGSREVAVFRVGEFNRAAGKSRSELEGPGRWQQIQAQA